jgi:hypothetical protein
MLSTSWIEARYAVSSRNINILNLMLADRSGESAKTAPLLMLPIS